MNSPVAHVPGKMAVTIALIALVSAAAVVTIYHYATASRSDIGG